MFVYESINWGQASPYYLHLRQRLHVPQVDLTLSLNKLHYLRTVNVIHKYIL